MTLEQLRVFLAVAARQHVTRAAEDLNLTQSAVSASVAALEMRHDVKLFDRIGRRIELTEAGRLFIPEARAILARAEAAELVLADLSGHTTGRVRVHASQTVASYWLPQRLVRLHELYPRIVVELSVGNTAQVGRAVLEGAADLGVVEGLVESPEIDKRVVGRDRLVLVVGRGHPWARRRKIRPQEFTASSWIIREAGSGTRAEFEELLSGFGLALGDLSVTLELPSNEAIIAAIAAGTGASVLSERAVRPAIAAGAVVAVARDLMVRDFVALVHSGRYHTRASLALLDLLAAAED